MWLCNLLKLLGCLHTRVECNKSIVFNVCGLWFCHKEAEDWSARACKSNTSLCDQKLRTFCCSSVWHCHCLTSENFRETRPVVSLKIQFAVFLGSHFPQPQKLLPHSSQSFLCKKVKRTGVQDKRFLCGELLSHIHLTLIINSPEIHNMSATCITAADLSVRRYLLTSLHSHSIPTSPFLWPIDRINTSSAVGRGAFVRHAQVMQRNPQTFDLNRS